MITSTASCWLSASAPLRRSSGPNASGSTSVIRRTPAPVRTCSSAPPFSQSSCRQRPHGISTSPSPSTQTTCDQPAAAGRVQRARPGRTRRTASRRTTRSRRCSPTTTRPSSTSAGRPDREVGVRRVGMLHRRGRRPRATSASRSRRRVGPVSSLTYGSPSAAGARTRPTSPATATIVATYGSIAQEVRRDRTGALIDSIVCSASAKPNSSAAATAPRGLQRPKIRAASAMKPWPEVMFFWNAPTEPIVKYAPPRPGDRTADDHVAVARARAP